MSTDSQSTTVDASTWNPTRHGTLITVVVTVTLTTLIAAALEMLVALAAAWGAALALAGGLWLATRSSWRVIAQYLAGVLVAPVGLTATGALAYTALTLSSTRFPQPTPAQGATEILAVIAHVIVVVGLLAAVFGACVAITDSVTPPALRALWGVTYRTLIVPALAAGTLIAVAVFGDVAISNSRQTVGTTVNNWVDIATSFFLTPTAGVPHVASLAVLLFAATVATSLVLRSLPLLAVLGNEHEPTLTAVRSRLNGLSWLFGILTIVGAGADLLLRDRQIRAELGETPYQYLVDATHVESLRMALAVIIAASAVLLAVSYTLKRAAQASAATSLERYSPLLSGATLTAGGFLVADPLVHQVQAFLITTLPSTITPGYRQLSTGVIAFYGPPAITLTALAAAFLITAAIIGGFRFGMWIRLLPSKTVGPALAGAGLFTASAFAGVGPLPNWLFFVSLVGSFVAWDSGHFAWQLGKEIGRHTPTRNAEAVHLTGTLLVGAAATTIAIATLQYATTLTFIDPTSIPAALVGAAASIFLLVFAIR